MFFGVSEGVRLQRQISKDLVRDEGSKTDEIDELNERIRQLGTVAGPFYHHNYHIFTYSFSLHTIEIDNSKKTNNLVNTSKKLDDAIRTKMEIEEKNEALHQQLKQLEDLQSIHKQTIDTLNERLLTLEDKNSQATNDLIVANETIQKLRAEKEIEIRKVINIAKKLDDAIHTKMNSEEELEETQARMRELESELIMSRKGSIDSSTFSGLVLSRSEDFSVSEKYENMSELSSPGKAPEGNAYDTIVTQQRLDDLYLIKELQGEIEGLKSELSHYKDSTCGVAHTPTNAAVSNTHIEAESPLVKLQKVSEILQHTPNHTISPMKSEPKEMYDWSREELLFELIEQKIRYALVSFELEEKSGKLHSLLKRIKQHKSKKN